MTKSFLRVSIVFLLGITLISPSLVSSIYAGAPVETFTETYFVPGNCADTKFNFVSMAGGLQSSFGYYLPSEVSTDPDVDRQGFIDEAMNAPSTTQLFTEVGGADAPGAMINEMFTPGTELGFWLNPENTLAHYQSNPNSYKVHGGSLIDPFFSVPTANPSDFDQLKSFIGGGVTTFNWEDWELGGDQDFNDIVFNIECDLLTGLPVGGKIIPIDTTSLLLAGAQSFSWMIPVMLSVLGIGLFVVSRKSENS